MTIATCKILLVDDSESDIETYRRYLLRDKQRKYRILEARTGEKALLLCQQQFPDVIVMDYLLPDMDGLELLQELKAEFGKICPPVIILTGQGNEQIAVQAMKGGAADYLVKKNTTQLNFIKAVENVLEKTRLSRQLEESEGRFKATFNQASVGIAHVGLEGQWLLVNQKFCDIMGYGPEELHQLTWKDITHPDDRNLDLEYFVRLLSGEIATYSLEKHYIRQDNRQVWINLTLSLVRKPSGEPEYFICVVQDITKRQQALSDLRESEAKFQRMAMNLPGAIYQYVLHPDGSDEFTYLSPSSRDIYELEPEELLQDFRVVWTMIHPDDVEAVHRANARSMQTLEAFDIQFRLIPPSGRIKWVHAKSQPQRQENGDLVFDGLVVDISDRKQAELEIRKFVALADNISEFIGMCDMNFVPFYVNQAGRQMVGLNDTRPLNNLSVQDWFFPEDRDFIIQEFFPQLLRDGRAEVEIRFRHFQTGEALWMIYSVVCIKDTNNQPIALGTVSRNITVEKQDQEKIREQAALLDVTTDAIFVRNLENCISYWNAGAEHLYGWQAAEVLGRNCHEFLCKEITPGVEEACRTVLEQGEWQGELNKITKSGKGITVQTRWTLMRDEPGQPKSILCVDTDITEKKQLQDQFYRAQRLESLGTLASGIAHDLNNILTPILTVAQLLQMKFPTLEVQNRQLLKILEDNSKRGAEIVKQITAFARGAEGKRVALQPRHLIKEIARIVNSTFPKSIEISTNITAVNLWTVSADPTQIHQVLMNLCVNARDAMPDGGRLRISADNFRVDDNYAKMNLEAKVGDYVAIAVSDTGCGMSPEVLERIFEPFFTTKETGKGTGLGLSTVIGIIKNHDGFVNVQSQVGEGSQFQVFLPAIETVAIELDEDSQIARGNGELILIVDDEALVRDVAKTSLEVFNYRVLTASDSIEAFSLYAQYQNEISLVLMDIQMPSMDGLNVIRVLQRMNPAVKIIAISGLASNRQLLEARGIEVQGFLPKPYTMKELLDTIQGILSLT